MAKTYIENGLIVTEFQHVSKHLDNDFVELLLAEARKRAGEIVLQEDIDRCKGCVNIMPDFTIPS